MAQAGDRRGWAVGRRPVVGEAHRRVGAVHRQVGAVHRQEAADHMLVVEDCSLAWGNGRQFSPQRSPPKWPH